MAKKSYWLMKSEPDVYSIDDLEDDGRTHWEGVRNYAARNNIREMKKGDEVLFYHSATRPPGVAGLARVVKEAYSDRFAIEEGHEYHDPKSDPDDPTWYMVDVEFVERFPEPLTLKRIKEEGSLGDMVLVNNPRLSVQPVTRKEFDRVLDLARGA